MPQLPFILMAIPWIYRLQTSTTPIPALKQVLNVAKWALGAVASFSTCFPSSTRQAHCSSACWLNNLLPKLVAASFNTNMKSGSTSCCCCCCCCCDSGWPCWLGMPLPWSSCPEWNLSQRPISHSSDISCRKHVHSISCVWGHKGLLLAHAVRVSAYLLDRTRRMVACCWTEMLGKGLHYCYALVML